MRELQTSLAVTLQNSETIRAEILRLRCFGGSLMTIQLLRLKLWFVEFCSARERGFSYWRSLRFAEQAYRCEVCGWTVCRHEVTGGRYMR